MSLDDPQQMQGYSYADNSPITKSDPSGQMWGFLKSAYDFVDRHKTVIGLALTAVMLVTPVGWAADAALLASTALTAIDMKDQLDKRRERQYRGESTVKQDILFGLDALSLGLAGAAASAGGLADEAYETGYAIYASNTRAGRESLEAGHAIEDAGEVANRAGYATQAGSVGYDNCYLQAGDAPELPCGQQVPPPDPDQYQYCKPGTNMCVCVAPPMASVKARGGSGNGRAGGGGGSRPSYNLGPDKPGPDRPAYGSPKSQQMGYYQTSDGLFHSNSGKGLAFF
jgi:hypothetical protein